MSAEADDIFFMAVALLAERRSKDPVRKVGACIVNEDDHRILSIGYNGMPLNCRDELMPWEKHSDRNKHLYVVHAEMNAIVNMTPQSVDGCTIYVTLHPCIECAKVLVQSGIKKVIFLSFDKSYRKKEEFKRAKLLFKNFESIKYAQFTGGAKLAKEKIWILDFKSTVAKWVETHSRETGGNLETYKAGDKFIRKAIDISGNESLLERAKKVENFNTKISWEQYHMGMAMIARDLISVGNVEQGKKKIPKNGACIVNKDNRIIASGHVRLLHANEVSHAPIVSIVSKTPISVRDCTMYVTCFPCNSCARVIIQAGITTVIYLKTCEDEESKLHEKAAKTCEGDELKLNEESSPVAAAALMFDLAKVKFAPYSYEDSPILIDFTDGADECLKNYQNNEN